MGTEKISFFTFKFSALDPVDCLRQSDVAPQRRIGFADCRRQSAVAKQRRRSPERARSLPRTGVRRLRFAKASRSSGCRDFRNRIRPETELRVQTRVFQIQFLTPLLF